MLLSFYKKRVRQMGKQPSHHLTPTLLVQSMPLGDGDPKLYGMKTRLAMH